MAVPHPLVPILYRVVFPLRSCNSCLVTSWTSRISTSHARRKSSIIVLVKDVMSFILKLAIRIDVVFKLAVAFTGGGVGLWSFRGVVKGGWGGVYLGCKFIVVSFVECMPSSAPFSFCASLSTVFQFQLFGS